MGTQSSYALVFNTLLAIAKMKERHHGGIVKPTSICPRLIDGMIINERGDDYQLWYLDYKNNSRLVRIKNGVVRW